MSRSSQDEYEMAVRVIQTFVMEYLERKSRSNQDLRCLFTNIERFPTSSHHIQKEEDEEGEVDMSEFYSKEEERAVVVIQRVGRGYLGKRLLVKIKKETRDRVEDRREGIHQSALHLTQSISMLSTQETEIEEEERNEEEGGVNMNSLLPP